MNTQEEFEDFFRKNALKLIKWAHFLCGNSAQAQDLVSQAIQHAWVEWSTKGPVNLSWAKQRVQWLWNDHCKKPDTKRVDRRVDTEMVEQRPYQDSSPEVDLSVEVRRTVRELPEPLRTAIFAKFYLGMKPRDAERELGIPSDQFSRDLHKAKAELRKLLEHLA